MNHSTINFLTSGIPQILIGGIFGGAELALYIKDPTNVIPLLGCIALLTLNGGGMWWIWRRKKIEKPWSKNL